MSENIKGIGIVLGYRRGSNTQYVNNVLLKVIAFNGSNVASLIGSKVVVKDKYGNEYVGKIVRVHARGRNNVVIARFNRNLPGQTIGSEAVIF